MTMSSSGASSSRLTSRLRLCVTPVALTALLSASACSDMTGPSEAPGDEIILTNGPALGALVAGESSRIIPSVSPGAQRDRLAVSLEQLSDALDRGLASRVNVALADLEVALNRFETSISSQDAAAELAAIRHAVDIVREAMTVSDADAR
jgi:hypothetical protein